MSKKGALTPYPFAYFEGKTVPIKDAQVSIMTNALHYGIGIFGGIKSFETDQGPAIFRLDDHLRRLENSVRTLDFNFDFDHAKIKKIILELARKNKIDGTAYIRPIIYRSDTDLSPDIAGEYRLAVYMLDMPYYFEPDKGIRVMISSWQRNPDKAIPPRTKATGGYINSALAIHEAQLKGFDSAIMLDKDGNVSEGAVMNLFLVKDGVLITPSLDSDILEGITRRTVIEIAEGLKIPVEERRVQKQEIFEAEEVFFSGTAAEITWCAAIDDKEVSSRPGAVTKELAKHFQSLVAAKPYLFTSINQTA